MTTILKLCLVAFFACALLSCKESSKAPISSSETPTQVQSNDAKVVDINAKEAEQIIHSDIPIIILDVRTAEEISDGKITGAMHIDVLEDDFTDRISSLDREGAYIVYCKMGGRSAKASARMIDLGFTHVMNVEGGYEEWSTIHKED